MLKNFVYLNLCIQLGDASIEVAELLRTGESLSSGLFFTKYDDYMTSYRKYPIAFMLEWVMKEYFFYFSIKTYVVGTQKNRLNETILLSTKTYVKTVG